MRLIIVEDEPFIALDLEMLATSAGHGVVGVADSFASALALYEAHTPTAALIDLNLSDGPTGSRIARALIDRGVAVGFITGNPDQLPRGFEGATGVLDKPFADQGVLEMFDVLQGRPVMEACHVRPVPD